LAGIGPETIEGFRVHDNALLPCLAGIAGDADLRRNNVVAHEQVFL
jgi:hypothetical protein